MPFVKGMDLCRSFCAEIVEPLIQKAYPILRHTLGLLGYGSDVLGYDDAVSTDHMWGPRFHLFLRPEDMPLKPGLDNLFREHLPTTFMGYSVNYSGTPGRDGEIRDALRNALAADTIAQREPALVQAQLLVARTHNGTGLTKHVPVSVQPYFDRDIQVIDTDTLAEAARETIGDPLLRAMPAVGTFSQVGNFVHLSDPPHLVPVVAAFFRRAAQENLSRNNPAAPSNPVHPVDDLQ